MKIRSVLYIICLATLSVPVQTHAQAFPFYGRTIGALPYFEYGPGDDRLGGAKMTYMDSNVLVKVVDTLGTDYIIELTKNLQAFIARSSIRIDSQYIPKPYQLSGNWKSYSDNRFDYIRIAMPERLPFRGAMQTGPSRLIIDLFGITSNTNWITQVGSASAIKNTWFEQVENGLYRVYIDLKNEMHWGYAVRYDSASSVLVIKVKHAPDKNFKNLRVAIDAGHGGDNTGTAGNISGKSEKRLTLEYATALEKELRKSGLKNIFMTRREDTSLSMQERVLMLREASPDLLVSIHFNSSSADTINGTSTFYRYIGFRTLTQTILKRMKELGLNEFGNVGSFNFALSGPTDYPNALVEVAFLSNKNDEKFILSKKSPANVAKKIRQGIKDWLEMGY
jgi:N-acetylmuramoyl-L-alanine amidase